MQKLHVIWTDYIKYRLKLRNFDLAGIEHILRFSGERYRDVITGRLVAVGQHGKSLVMVPYEYSDGKITPITVHVTSRQQIQFRIKTGRFANE